MNSPSCRASSVAGVATTWGLVAAGWQAAAAPAVPAEGPAAARAVVVWAVAWVGAAAPAEGPAAAPAGAVSSSSIASPSRGRADLAPCQDRRNQPQCRSIGVSWVYARGQSIFGSAAGNNSLMTFSANTAVNQGTGLLGFAQSPQRTAGAANLATPSGSAPLFGVFNSGHFSLFINALGPTAWRRSWPSRIWLHSTANPPGSWSAVISPIQCRRARPMPGGTAVVTIQFDRFGTILTFLPQILANDVIRLDVEPVISQLDFASGTTVNGGNVPGIDERSARTVVELREGQTLAIAGLLQSTPRPPRTAFPVWAICRSSDPGSAPTVSRRSRPRPSCWSLPNWSPRSKSAK